MLRRSLGDRKREIEPGRDARVSLDALPLSDAERQIAQSLHGASTIEGFLKGSGVDTVSGVAAAVVGSSSRCSSGVGSAAVSASAACSDAAATVGASPLTSP